MQYFLLDRISLTHSLNRLSTIESQEEDDQEEAVTQTLIIAQQATVAELERLEEEQESTDIDHPLSADEETNPNSEGQSATAPTHPSIPPSPRNEANRRSAYLNDILFGSSIDVDPRPRSLESNWTSTHSWRQSSTSSRQSVYLLQKWTDQGGEKPGTLDTTFSPPISTEAERLRELKLQLSQSLQTHQELKASYEAREQEAEETNREKLSQLENDYQSAVHYVKGTEKLLKRMKEELAKYKADMKKMEAKVIYVTIQLNKSRADYTKIKEEAEEAKATYEAREKETEKTYREKLTQLESDYQSAVHYVKSTEKLL